MLAPRGQRVALILVPRDKMRSRSEDRAVCLYDTSRRRAVVPVLLAAGRYKQILEKDHLDEMSR